jgi:hypothetical protein
MDVLSGLQKVNSQVFCTFISVGSNNTFFQGLENNFFDFETFDVEEYEHYEVRKDKY